MPIKLNPISTQTVVFTIIGTRPLIQHKWAEKAIKQIKDKKLGASGRTKNREKCDPEQEMIAATYLTDDGEYGIPAMAFKKALITAAHKDIGIEKTLLRKSLFLVCDDDNMVLPIECDNPVMREDYVRVGAGSADLRWRPEFKEWSCRIKVEIDADNISVDSLINLINRAGFGVGIGEMRPEKGGEYGRFCVDETAKVEVK